MRMMMMTEAAVTKEDINQQQYRSDDAALDDGLAHVAGLVVLHVYTGCG